MPHDVPYDCRGCGMTVIETTEYDSSDQPYVGRFNFDPGTGRVGKTHRCLTAEDFE